MNQAKSKDPGPHPREHFIPVPLSMLSEELVEHLKHNVNEQAFRSFAHGLTLLYDALFSQRLEDLKRLYYPYNPDRPAISPEAVPEKGFAKRKEMIAEIESLLQRANFQRLDQASLNLALNKTSPEGVIVSVDLDEFDEVLIYYCGSTTRTVDLPFWRRLLEGKEKADIPVYRRLFVLLKFKNQLEREGGNAVFIKLFKDIPQSDLETIFPNTKIRLSLFDKVKLGVTGGGGVIAGIMSATGKIAAAAANPMAAISAVGALGAVIWKQVANVLSQRTEYMAKLAKSLYFYNLDNNAGALAWLVEVASTEEAKEALLAYGFLLARGEMSRQVLDREVEEFMRERFSVEMDFEVDDGLEKLHELGLLERIGEWNLAVKGREEACGVLKDRWIGLFPVRGASA